MKRLSKYSFFLIVSLFACKKDDPMVAVSGNPTAPVLAASTSTIANTITAANLTDVLAINWSAADYGVATQVTYTVQLDSKCNTFANPVVVGTSTSTSYSIALADLNTKLLGTLHVAPNKVANLQLRVVSVINANGAMPLISPIVPITIKTYSDQPDILWLGANNPAAPMLYANGKNTYEGYKNIPAATTFNLTDSPVCPDSVYGTAGAGKLSMASGAAGIPLPAGYYKINVDTKALTIDTMKVQWGLIGDATVNGWNSSTAMTYNAGSDTWSASVPLVPGSVKFRANNAWDLNYGPANSASLTGTLITTNDAITITAAATYLVTIDFSQSKSPYQYVYSVVQTSAVNAPPTLWLPGGYEGFAPATAPTIYESPDSAGVYDGFVTIPSSTGVKFTSAPDYSHINYGDSGKPNVLSTDGAATDINVGAAGLYYFHANTTNLWYEIYLVNSLGAIGDATTGGWNTSTAMTYNATANTWSVTLPLINGSLKFRANDEWTVNFGPTSSTDLVGTLTDTQASITINDPGTYTVTIDMSRSATSATPYTYSYTVVKN